MSINNKLKSFFLFLADAEEAESCKHTTIYFKNLGLSVFLTVLIVGLLAHGYAFFDAAFTHDSLNALYADPAENAWKISLGRIFTPLYHSFIRGEFAAP